MATGTYPEFGKSFNYAFLSRPLGRQISAMAYKPRLRPGAEYPDWVMKKMRRHPSQAAAIAHAFHRGTLKNQ